MSVWFDEEEILPGMSIVDSINSGLKRSKGCVALISKDFIDSTTRWTKMETNYFLNLIGGGNDNYIVPVLLEVSYKDLPPLLQDVKALIYGEENWEEKLLASVKKMSGVSNTV